MTLYAFALTAAFAVAISVYDLKTMTIPNWLNAAAGVSFLALIVIALPMAEVWPRVIGAGLVLAVGVLLFFANAMGGGDVKAATAFALLIAPGDAGVVLVMLSLVGLIGIAVFWVLRRTPLAAGSWQVWASPRAFPYGVVLSATTLIYMGLTVFFLS